MHRHHPHRVRTLGRVTLNLDVAARKPRMEAFERWHLVALELERGGHQLVDRIARREAEAAVKLAATVERTRENGLQEARRSGVIGHAQQVAERRMRRREILALPCPFAQRPPQPPFPPMCEIEQLLLVPADQRRHQQVSKVEVVERLHRERNRRQQVPHREGLGQEQPVDPSDRHASGEEPRDD